MGQASILLTHLTFASAVTPFHAVFDIVFSPDGTLVATASERVPLRLWRTRDGECIATDSDPEKAPSRNVFSDDGELLVMRGRNGKISILNTGNGHVRVL